MMVARHKMCHPEARPVLSAVARLATEEGYGLVGKSVAPQITPFPTGRIMSTLSQAFHA
jgi:hypothetical protein